MYKEHLVENVTSSLSDLGNFIRKADEGKSFFQENKIEFIFLCLRNFNVIL